MVWLDKMQNVIILTSTIQLDISQLNKPVNYIQIDLKSGNII